MKSAKILFAGIGGVGGYFGGLFAHRYENDKNIDVYFLARGEHLNKIKNNGLKVIVGNTEFITRPSIATDNPNEIGVVDFIFICTKTYDLKTVVKTLTPCINAQTIITSLLNGVNNKVEIQNILPNNRVINGCVYLVSRLKGPGIIENSGNIESFYFGTDNQENEKLIYLESLLLNAKIDAHYSTKISAIIWEKFIFLSPLATGTTAYNKSIGELLESKEHIAVMTALVDEVRQIAKAKKIVLNEGITEKTIAKLKLLPGTITSSMHSDFQLKKPKNELETLTSFVISEGERYGIETPTYKMALDSIKELLKTSYC